MYMISQLRPAKRAGYLEVAVDGTTIGSVPEHEVASRGLVVGQRIDAETLAALERAASVSEALLVANRFLAHRPRTAAEVRRRLRQDQLDDETIDQVLERLTEQGLLDDRRFASLWIENRTTFSPRGSRALDMELRRKGVERETIEEALAQSPAQDETALAVDAGRKRLRAFGALDEQTFARRMGGYLGRRGFGYETVAAAIRLLWQELRQPE